MKYFFSRITIAVVLISCSSEDSEGLRSARAFQAELIKERLALDSLIDASVARFNAELSELSQNPGLMTSEEGRAQFEKLQSKVSLLAVRKSEIADWFATERLIPKGSFNRAGDNPFGAGVTDEEIVESLDRTRIRLTRLKNGVTEIIEE